MLDNHRRGDAKDLGFQRRVLQAVSEQDVRSPLVECSYSVRSRAARRQHTD